ncbi:hypothetical protein KRX11_10200 [Pasteurellaceae bacterium TAE3-ERU1]|nr:hypothetical protein [Pasteurellaceae bacterium TAE3-ERU1]
MIILYLFLWLLEILLIAGFFIAASWWLKLSFVFLAIVTTVAIHLIYAERTYRAVNNLE